MSPFQQVKGREYTNCDLRSSDDHMEPMTANELNQARVDFAEPTKAFLGALVQLEAHREMPKEISEISNMYPRSNKLRNMVVASDSYALCLINVQKSRRQKTYSSQSWLAVPTLTTTALDALAYRVFVASTNRTTRLIL